MYVFWPNVTNVIWSNDFQDTKQPKKPYDQIQESWEGIGKDRSFCSQNEVAGCCYFLWYVVVAAYPMTCSGRMIILSLGCKLERFQCMQILIEIPSTKYPFGELFGNAISNLQDHRMYVSVSIWGVGWSRKMGCGRIIRALQKACFYTIER